MPDPADGATTRKNRQLDMLRYAQTFMPEGISHTKLMGYMDLQHGLTPATAGSYIQGMIRYGILKPEGNMLLLNQAQFDAWMDMIGFGPPVIQVTCTDCGAIYSSRRASCPSCDSVAREATDPKELKN